MPKINKNFNLYPEKDHYHIQIKNIEHYNQIMTALEDIGVVWRGYYTLKLEDINNRVKRIIQKETKVILDVEIYKNGKNQIILSYWTSKIPKENWSIKEIIKDLETKGLIK